ncbi:MAG: hypothetical protein PF904_16575 [Kiritimatiellae bacterium]|jgi:DNA-binding Lrp family transcriptional regulator|nr:hypothetical protein [Kiritimatiellia bacterium]
MLEMSDKESQLIMAAQRGIPVVERPFAVLGEACDISEGEVIDIINKLRASGEARRFGAVFDSRKLGYRSTLCSMQIPEDEISDVSRNVTALRGVTHAYQRGWNDELSRDSVGGPRDNSWPNFWFTLATPAKSFQNELDTLRTACAPYDIYDLPALIRFKIDVVFDLRTRERDERVEPRSRTDLNSTEVYELDQMQQSIVKYLEGDIPVVSEFYGAVADHLSVEKSFLLETLSVWQSNGVMRRIGLLLRHRKVGYKANGMCCWNVPEDKIVEVGRLVASVPEVTHCYERPAFNAFPFNLFAMIHTTAWENTQALFQRISDDSGLSNGQLLLSVREFKKTSMQFF